VRLRTILQVVIAAALLSSLALAGPFSYLIAYGDSLSDNGNFYAITGQPPAPYWNGRVSNGPVAAEIMAAAMGATLQDFAWAGATTGIGNINDIPTPGTTTALGSFNLPGMKTTFDSTKASLVPIAPSSEFILWGGAMDFIYPAEPIPDIIGRGVANLVQMTSELQAMRAGMIVVPGMPDLGLTPRAMSYGPAVASGFSQVTDIFNMALRSNLPPGAAFFDTAALMRHIIANPGDYGFTNVTEPCFVSSPSPSICADPAAYFFWDDIHPTTATHAILAENFLEIPEPATFFFVSPVLVLVALARVRHRGLLTPKG